MKFLLIRTKNKLDIAIKMLFKKFSTATIFMLINTSVVAEEAVHFPTNHGSEIVTNSIKYDAELVAIEVRITEISDNGRNHQTYMKAEFRDGSEIWLAAIGKVSDSFKIGDVIHVLGYLATVNNYNNEALALNKSGWHVISLCYYNFRTKYETQFKFKNEPNQCSNWRNGKIGNY